MQVGDLVYIPQGVYIYSTVHGTTQTPKPVTAVLINPQTSYFAAKVFLEGREVFVKREHIYPLTRKGEQNVSKVHRSV
jgi:hypothetical protein